MLTLRMSRDCNADPPQENDKGREDENWEREIAEYDSAKTGNTNAVLLEIQYENKRPILLCDGRVLTKMAPSRAGMYMMTEAYPLPIERCAASVTPI